jgi:hypothetical protein
MFMFVDENPDSSFHVRPPLVACEASLSKPTQPSFLKQLRLIQQRRRLTSKGATSWKHQPRERSSIQMVKLLLGGAPYCIHNP